MTTETKTKTKTQLEYLFDQTVLTRRQCRCYGCGVSHASGSRMLRVLAIKKAGYVNLYFCRICREIGRDLTGEQWKHLRQGEIRATRKPQWLELHHKYHPKTEV